MVKRIIYIVILIVLITTSSHAQTTWFKTYGGYHDDEGFDVQQTADGGYIVVGRTYSFGAGSGDIYCIKTDEKGDTLWTKIFGGSLPDDGHSINQTSDNGYIIIGHLSYGDPARCGVYMVKTDANGDTLWTRNHLGEINAMGWAGQQTDDGGYVAAGSSNSGGILIKTNEFGDTLWTRVYDKEIIYKCYDVYSCEDSGYILTGEAGGLAALVKTDSLGHLIWSRHFGAKRLDRGYSVRQTTDGGYVITGIQYIPGGSESASCAFLVKTDASGDTLWTRKLGDDYSAGYCVRQTSDGGYIITGFIRYGYEVHNIYLTKTDAQGDPVWTSIFGIGESQSVRQIDDGGYVITGYTYVEGKYRDVFIIKTDDSGNITGIKKKKHFKEELSQHFKLHQNFPNPFNQSTHIVYELLGGNQDISLGIYDLTGRQVRTLVQKCQSSGIYSVSWDGRDEWGREVTSGVYLCQLEGGGGKLKMSKKLLLIR